MATRKAAKADGKQAKDQARMLQGKEKSTKPETSSSMSSSGSPVQKKNDKRAQSESLKRKASKEEDTQMKKLKSEEQKQDKDLTGTPLECD